MEESSGGNAMLGRSTWAARKTGGARGLMLWVRFAGSTANCPVVLPALRFGSPPRYRPVRRLGGLRAGAGLHPHHLLSISSPIIGEVEGPIGSGREITFAAAHRAVSGGCRYKARAGVR